MPHFVIECSDNIFEQNTPEDIMLAVYEAADATGLFVENDIKVRLQPYKHYKLGETKNDFIHIFGYVFEGRTIEQKTNLSRKIIGRLQQMFPHISILSMNISEFEKETYCNKSLINPLNTAHDRHFHSG